jgi:hypothetical protein
MWFAFSLLAFEQALRLKPSGKAAHIQQVHLICDTSQETGKWLRLTSISMKH